MASPLLKNDSVITVLNMKSAPYIGMTLRVMEKFGVFATPGKSGIYCVKGGQRYSPAVINVEGDWSGAAFLLVAGAIAGDVAVSNLESGSQGDERILDALRSCGAAVEAGGDRVRVGAGNLEAFEFDATDCPDLFPPLTVLASCCTGTSRIKGAGRLRDKESDRAAALVDELGGLGAVISLEGDTMIVTGSKIRGGAVNPRGDHRIAMAGAIAGLVSESGVRISDERCVAKSFPDFFYVLGSISAGGIR
jgi:3-phosphoshikimate 1-carboxyvinyltransferase